MRFVDVLLIVVWVYVLVLIVVLVSYTFKSLCNQVIETRRSETEIRKVKTLERIFEYVINRFVEVSVILMWFTLITLSFNFFFTVPIMVIVLFLFVQIISNSFPKVFKVSRIKSLIDTNIRRLKPEHVKSQGKAFITLSVIAILITLSVGYIFWIPISTVHEKVHFELINNPPKGLLDLKESDSR